MAFCDLKSVRIFDETSGCTFIIGDEFSVYPFGADRPVVYDWSMLKSVHEDKKSLVFNTGKNTYKIQKSCFKLREDYFRAIAIIESARRDENFYYYHENRILPLKYTYIEASIGSDAYVGEGVIDENETAAAFVMMMNFRLIKVLWLIAVVIMLVVFGTLHFLIGVNRDNILYFIPISIIVGGIATLLVYLICHAMARNKYQKMAGCDPAADETITFVVSPHGFAACESCVYDEQEIVPWRALDYFVETDKIYIFYKDGAAVVYMPKKAFDKKYLGGISDMISLNLEQK